MTVIRLPLMLLGALVAGVVFASGSLAEAPREERTVQVPEGDPEMGAAIAKARATLDVFWTALAAKAPGTETFSLKVEITDGIEVEHFLTSQVEQTADGRIFANIDNYPQFVRNVTFGQRIEVPQADISDWMFWRDGKVVGGETLRVLLKRMTPDERAAAGVDRLEFETP